MDTLIAFDEIQERLHHFKNGHLHTRYSENPLLLGLAYTLVTLEWEGTPDILSDAFLSDHDHVISFNKTLTRLGYQCIESNITHADQLLAIDCPSFITLHEQHYILLNFDDDILYLYDYENDITIESEAKGKLIAKVCAISKYSRLFREPPPESQDKRNWIKHVFYHYNNEFKSLALLSLLISLLGTLQPFFIMGVYTFALTADSISTLYWLASGAVVIAGMEYLFKKQRMAILNTSGQELARYISYQVISKLLWLPYSLTSNAATSSQLARLKDIDQFRQLVTAESSLSYFDLPFIFIFLIAIFIMSGSAAITVIIGIAIMMLFCIYARYIYMQATSRSSRANAMVSYQWNEILSNVNSIQKLPLLSVIKSRFNSALTQRLQDSHHVSVTNSKIQQLGSSFIQVIGTTTIVIAVTAVMAGDTNPGAMLAIIILVWKTLTPIMGIYNSLAKIDTIKASTAQINALMSLDDDKSRIEKSTPIHEFSGELSILGLSHRYQGVSKGLTNLSFAIKAGSKISICAPSGSGKTTLMNILSGIETRFQGRLLIDGYNINQFNNFRFRNSICYVPFDMHLYHGTVHANYTIYNGYVPPTFIDAMLNFLDLLPYLPNGKNTLLSADFLSSLPDGIQRKLTLAIGIGYCRKRVVIIDEPFVGSEHENSKYLTSLFSEYLANSTVIFTTTSKSMVATSDFCLLLEKEGSQKFYGTPDKVLQAAPAMLT
ncbi:ABC transporter permease [Aliivibrio sp. 1S165]|uniref:ATP-binding cassette domain-containing protein n=1 Tax=unclassified Aliivibrio TaxID=2645654 RepID=UPI00080D97BC|nr:MULTISPECIES: ATP-binding cassette domain-containing protein [unclassified Aliivibrio]OCH17411.1 ABC transporter permease [Aliivibrio sp. 1S165]OCH34404.1 ABC transporter permease [Aliivibrio sp. 1S175]